MKKPSRLVSDSVARNAAAFMEYICYFMVLFFVAGLVLSFMGRQTFALRTGFEKYNNAIYAEESHDWTSRGPTVSMKTEVNVNSPEGEVDIITQVGLSAMYAFTAIPLIIAFLILSRVFRNVGKGRIFISQNADYLLYYGLIQMAVAGLVPFINLIICNITNRFSGDFISVVTGKNLFNDLIPNIAFIVAAYIIRYGIHLQDEADHTL